MQDFDYLVGFMHGLARRLGRQVVLTPENGPDNPLIRIDPG